MGDPDRDTRRQAVFRVANEDIKHATDRFAEPGDGDLWSFVCECGAPRCSSIVEATLAEYERVRANGRRFIVTPAHVDAAAERVVENRPGHVVVEAIGPAATVADETDPRVGGGRSIASAARAP